MNRILFWGAGNTTKLFMKLIDMEKNQIVGIVDNRKDAFFPGYTTMLPEKIQECAYDLLIVCSRADIEILWQCRELGIKNCYSHRNKEKIYNEYPELFLHPNKVIEGEYRQELEWQNQSLLKELLWSNVFHDTVSTYEWFNVKSLSLGRSAIGYNFAYVISRILQNMHPTKILEFGLGQSSKIVSSYFQYYKKEGMVYDLVEHDPSWADFFSIENDMKDVKIHIKDISIHEKYQLIAIDGPYGYSSKYISRIDMLAYIPDVLETDWVILMDDYNRVSEKNAIMLFEKKLKEKNIIYYKGIYRGESDVCILASEKWKFFRTL